MVCKIQECSMTYRQSETYSHKMPQKLTTTACFIQEESSGGKQFRKHVRCQQNRCQHKNRFQVKSLNKERNACYFNDNTPTFPNNNKNSSHVFEIVYHLKIPLG